MLDLEESRKRVQGETESPHSAAVALASSEDTSTGTVDDEQDNDDLPESHYSPLPPLTFEPRPSSYKDLPVESVETTVDEQLVYSLANVSDCGLTLEADRFYDPLYRSTLRALVAHIIHVEGPIFEDVLIRRIARAHGFGRTGGKIGIAVEKAVDGRFPRSQEGDRPIYWPEGSDPTSLWPFRRSTESERDHADVPLIELASLARRYLEAGADHDETVRLMARDFGLGRLREPTRIRLLSAVECASVTGDRSLPASPA